MMYNDLEVTAHFLGQLQMGQSWKSIFSYLLKIFVNDPIVAWYFRIFGLSESKGPIEPLDSEELFGFLDISSLLTLQQVCAHK